MIHTYARARTYAQFKRIIANAHTTIHAHTNNDLLKSYHCGLASAGKKNNNISYKARARIHTRTHPKAHN